MCRFEHEDCVEKMHDQLALKTAASPDLQSIVYCGGLVSHTDLDEKFDYLYQRYLGNDAESLEKSRILSALGCLTSVDHINRFVLFLFSSS